MPNSINLSRQIHSSPHSICQGFNKKNTLTICIGVNFLEQIIEQIRIDLRASARLNCRKRFTVVNIYSGKYYLLVYTNKRFIINQFIIQLLRWEFILQLYHKKFILSSGFLKINFRKRFLFFLKNFNNQCDFSILRITK